MNGTLISLLCGLLLLGILAAIAFLRGHATASPPAEQEGTPEPIEILLDLNLEFPSRAVAGRIFDLQDWYFVMQEAPSLQKTFLQERKGMGILWLQETRRTVVRLHHLHRIAVRGAASLDVALELRTIADYYAFLLLSGTAHALIYFFGPFRVHWIIDSMFGVADQVSSAVGNRLAALEPARLARIKEEWTQHSDLAT
jgi:hypothetical protein